MKGAEHSSMRPYPRAPAPSSRAAANAGEPPSFDLQPGRSDALDEAIALIAAAMRILLTMGAELERQAEPNRSPYMGTEAAAVNGSDRYEVFVVENYEDREGAERSNWTRVGVAFPHKDGLGLNVDLKAIPVSGKLVIRRHDAKARAQQT